MSTSDDSFDPDPDFNVDTSVDQKPAPDEPSLTEYDKTLADSFPSSDPPAQP
jgi:hypothetical protein